LIISQSSSERYSHAAGDFGWHGTTELALLASGLSVILEHVSMKGQAFVVAPRTGQVLLSACRDWFKA